MNFLTKTLNSLTGQAIPYNKGKFVAKVENIWEIYDGTSKNDNSNVSIFQFDKQQSYNYKFALNCAKKLSIIKFPGVLRVIEVIDNETILYMITERVEPLSYSTDTKESKILGIYNIAQTLKFINHDATSVHGKVNLESVFVTESGEWKLGGFEILTNLNDVDKNLLLQGNALPSFNNYVSPPELTSLDVLLKGKTGIKFDAFKLGCFILQVYNDNTAVTDPSLLANFLKNIPRSLQGGVKKLLSDSITTRATAELFVKKGDESFFQIELILNYKDLQELDLKSIEERLDIFDKISNTIKFYPATFFEFKLLPLLVHSYQLCEQQQQVEFFSRILYHILQLQELIKNEEKFNVFIKPVIFSCFAKNDRATRMILLTSLPQYIHNLEKSEINGVIFTNLVTGFNDTNAAIREETLKSIIVIAEFLTDRQLNNELLRYLAKLQNDESETIRTNVVICLSKIAHLMNKNSRANILITAFNKSIKDPFLPTRLSTIVAFGSCIEFFSAEIIASRILSSIAPSLLDKSYKIRQEASKIFQIFLELIHKEAEKLPNTPDDDEDSKDIGNLSNKLQDTTLGWGHLNRYATPPITDSESSIKWDHSKNNISSTTTTDATAATVDNFEFPDDDDDIIDDFDEAWGDEEEQEEEVKAVPTKPVVAPRAKIITGNTTTTTKTKTIPFANKKPTTRTGGGGGGLKLQSKPKTSRLKLDLKLDQDDNGWGDGWD